MKAAPLLDRAVTLYKFDIRTHLSDNGEDRSLMDDKEFKKRLKNLAKDNDVAYQETRQGKGSHSRVYYGDKFTTLKKGEIGKGLLGTMCLQLGINKKNLEK